MSMKPEFFCCIGAELKDEIAGSLKSSRVFLYRAAENQTISDMLADGFFNEADDLRVNDLILLYCPEKTRAFTYAKVSSVAGGVVKTTTVNIDPQDIPIDTTGYSNISGSNLKQVLDSIDAEFSKYLKLDGSTTMTGVLKMRASVSFECAVAPYWHGVGLYKLNDDDSVTLLASMEATDGWEPGANNTYNMGTATKKWKNLYLAGSAYISKINNGYDIAVPVTNSADTLALLSDIAFKSTDVTITSPSSGQFLMYDGNKWVNSTQGYANTDLSNLTATGEAKFTAKANTDLDNLTATGANIANWSSNVTNCITEIPQDIGLEINSYGGLVLKSGSKLYQPDNGQIYRPITIDTDKIRNDLYAFGSGTYMVFYSQSYGNLISVAINHCVSGTTDTSTESTHVWYDISTNQIKLYESGSYQFTDLSLPIAIVTIVNGTGVTSIDKRFEGFGYIGSTIFALPGVKGLIPNGRNTDGTLKNNTLKVTGVITKQVSEGAYYVVLSNEDIFGDDLYCYRYNATIYLKDENRLYDTYAMNFIPTDRFIAGQVTQTSGVITSFDIKTPFRAVDYNDTEYIAHQAMPSNKYNNLTLGANLSEYTAPADGYFAWRGNLRGTVGYFNLANTNLNIGSSSYTTYSGDDGTIGFCFVPVKKGDVVVVNYYAGTSISTTSFRFIYAQGVQ